MNHIFDLYEAYDTFRRLRMMTGAIAGPLDESEGAFLYLLARYGEGCGAVVDIGGQEGQSTVSLALGCRDARREKVHAIDATAGLAEAGIAGLSDHEWAEVKKKTLASFQSTIAATGVGDYVVLDGAASADVSARWSGPIRLLFVGGHHDFTTAALHFQSWCPHVVPGGYIALYDYGRSAGVTQLCEDVIKPLPEYPVAALAGSLMTFQYMPT